jgi:hypothetical protein
MVGDVMHAAGGNFFVSISSPLELTLVTPLRSLGKEYLGSGVQSHILTLQTRGFNPVKLMVDPHKTLALLETSFPGIEVDLSGAGDHLNKVDSKIRRIKETARSMIAGLPFRIGKPRAKDLITYAVSRVNVKTTSSLNNCTCPRVRFTGLKPEFKNEIGLSFGDYVEVYNPRVEGRSNDVLTMWTEPCIALYPSANRKGSWIMLNLNSNSYVRRTQWKKLPVNQLILSKMNELDSITLADIPIEETESEHIANDREIGTHVPPTRTQLGMTMDKEALGDHDPDMPNLCEGIGEDDSDSESEEVIEDQKVAEFDAILNAESSVSESATVALEEQARPVRRSTRTIAGTKRYDKVYKWNLLNLSVKTTVKDFGNVAIEAVRSKLKQLFEEKKALMPVKYANLSKEQRKRVVNSHMFLKEKFDDGRFVKMKARLVANGRMQDSAIYCDYSSPTAKTRSVMTCLKIAAVKGWDLLKIDVGGAFLCASMDDTEEFFMSLDKELSAMAAECMLRLKEFIDSTGRITVQVDKAMYGLIQSTKLWYNELTKTLMSNGFKKVQSDECVLVKTLEGGRHLVILLCKDDDLLVMSSSKADRHWVKDLLERVYGKVTYDEGNRLPYLGMTVIKTKNGFAVCMRAYMEDVLQLYSKESKECVIPTTHRLLTTDESSPSLKDREKFHSIVAKLMYCGKRSCPDILLAVQFLCTRVKAPTIEDATKLAKVLEYLKLMKTWVRVFDDSPFDRVQTYIVASFAMHADGKSQSACVEMLGNTLVHEACRKQKLITKSSTEAKLVALLDYIAEGELIDHFIMDLGHLLDDDIVTNVHLVYQDNQSTIALVKNRGRKSRSKYIKVRQEYV